MAAYAALLSLMYTINQIQHHPRPPISLDKTQVESLTEKVTFLQEFLEGYSHVSGYTKKADPLELRIADAAYAAEDVIESHIVDQIHARSTTTLGEENSSLELYEGVQKVIDDMGLVKKEVMEIKEKIGGVSQHQLLQRSSSTAVASFRSSSNVTMVGFNDVLIEVMDKLTRGQLDRQIISIVGMGGIGKTTLAQNIYKHPLVTQHFGILLWVTVSQDYKTREILSQLVLGGGSSQMDEYELGEQLHKNLLGRRYLIFLDDVWDIQVWDRIRRFLPSNNNGSRVVITTRISDFQVSHSYVVKMKFLDEGQSWSLFSKTVFGDEGCPVELKVIGEKIAKNCGGLPLSIVVVGGLLAKSERSQEYWENIAENLNSIVNSEDDESCLKILHMSYNQLPVYLKPCFLYLGVFQEDEKIRVSDLVKLWVAEGILKPISCKIWEEIAEEYLKELINRNLVLVNELGCTGNVKKCYIHDLLRDLCLREAQKQRFYDVMKQHSVDAPQDLSTQRRIVIPDSISREEIDALQYMPLVRSLIYYPHYNAPMHKFRLLKIMSCSVGWAYKLEDMLQLVNSRCIILGLRDGAPNFLSSHAPRWKLPPLIEQECRKLGRVYEICKNFLLGHIDGAQKFLSSHDLLWNLHTLIARECGELERRFEIWKMPQLRHLQFSGGVVLEYPRDDKDGMILENLETLGGVLDFKFRKEVVKRVPNIKKLSVSYETSDERDNGFNNFCHLQKLESLKFYCRGVDLESGFLQNLTFSQSLKKLELYLPHCHECNNSLEKIGSLPCLEKLTFAYGSFNGCKWETVEGQFPKLKFLKISFCMGLKYWITESSHFPCLEHLLLEHLITLREIPSEIGEIATLQSITLLYCGDSIIFSAKKLQEEREELYGEAGLHVRARAGIEFKREDLQRLAAPNFHISS